MELIESNINLQIVRNRFIRIRRITVTLLINSFGWVHLANSHLLYLGNSTALLVISLDKHIRI